MAAEWDGTPTSWKKVYDRWRTLRGTQKGVQLRMQLRARYREEKANNEQERLNRERQGPIVPRRAVSHLPHAIKRDTADEAGASAAPAGGGQPVHDPGNAAYGTDKSLIESDIDEHERDLEQKQNGGCARENGIEEAALRLRVVRHPRPCFALREGAC